MAENETKNPPSVYEIVSIFLEQMVQVSWQKLGLQSDPYSGKIEANLPEAKVAIDLVAHMASVVEGQLDDADRRQIHNLIRDLRVNYVQRNNGAQS